AVLVKMAIAQIRVLPALYHQLTALARRLGIDSCSFEAANVVFHEAGINYVKGLLPTLDPFGDKREQHPVFFIGRVEKGANMALRSERRIGKVNWLFDGDHYTPPNVA